MWMCVYIWTSNVTCRHMQPAQTTRQHINARIKCVWILHNSITFIGMLSISHTPYTPHTVHCMHAIHFHLYCVRMANEEFGLCVVGMRLMCNVFPTWVNCLQSTANNHLQYKLNAHNAPYEQRAYSIQVKWIHFRSPHRPDSRVRIYVYYSNESSSRKNSKYDRRKKLFEIWYGFLYSPQFESNLSCTRTQTMATKPKIRMKKIIRRFHSHATTMAGNCVVVPFDDHHQQTCCNSYSNSDSNANSVDRWNCHCHQVVIVCHKI